MLGVVYWHQGDFERAVTELNAAISKQPDYADAHYALGSVLKAGKDWKGAAAALRHAIAIRSDPATHYTLAQVLQHAGDQAGASAEFAESERLRQRTEQDQQASVWTAVGTRKLDAGDPSGRSAFRRATTVSDRYALLTTRWDGPTGVGKELWGERSVSRPRSAQSRPRHSNRFCRGSSGLHKVRPNEPGRTERTL
jgi:tetratricopeptide (TPR) repeat protein